MGKEQVDRLLASLVESKGEMVSEFETKEVIRNWGLSATECMLADSVDEAIQFGKGLGYPIVLKVHSPAITHKSDIGGVKLNLKDPGEVKTAYEEIKKVCESIDPNFRVLVQPMAKPGIEVILGVSRDPQFGPAVMFGLGGVFVELFEDVSFRLIPLSGNDAIEMITSIRAFPLLKGYRGKEAVDIEMLSNMIVSLSNLVVQYPFISEIDLNPVIVYSKGATIVDARMKLT